MNFISPSNSGLSGPENGYFKGIDPGNQLTFVSHTHPCRLFALLIHFFIATRSDIQHLQLYHP